MAALKGTYRNVFDNQAEFDKLNNLILGAIEEFSKYRQGNLTYGEIMFVLESVLDRMRNTSEGEAKTYHIKGMREAPSFSALYNLVGRLVEAMAQVSAVLIFGDGREPDGKLAFFLGVDKAKFRRTVVPGDQLIIECEMVRRRKNACKVAAKALVDGRVAAEAVMTFGLMPMEQ